ncbi:MAG: NUDIX hydrolase [Planctomycetota bacterium]
MWQREAKHCPMCSGDLLLAPVGGRDRLRCTGCGFVLYENPASAAAAVVLNERREVLLVRRAFPPYRGSWALPAGYQEIDEDAPASVRREVAEETGIEVRVLGYLDHIFVPDDPRRPANVAILLCEAIGGALARGGEETEVGWFALDALPAEIGFGNYERILSRLADRSRYPESAWNRLGRMLARRDGEER